jgi:hypothetical protein
MTTIRPLARTDLGQVASLYERVVRSGRDDAPAPLADYFGRLCFDQPWSDPEIPALVSEDRDGSIVGFLGSYPRRARVDGRAIRIACSGNLVADPGHPGVGALLTRAYLRGPQELTVTDGATDLMYRIWTGLKGQARVSASWGWYRMLRPLTTLGTVMGERRSMPSAVLPVARGLDAVGRRLPRLGARFSAGEPGTIAEELTPAALLEQMAAASRRWRLHPDYDVEHLEWLFAELDGLDVRGPLIRHLVRNDVGRVLGWYVYFRPPGGVAEVLQLAAPQGQIEAVFDHLVADAERAGALAVHGRLEPALAGVVRARRCTVRPTTWALVHTDNSALLGLLSSTDALLTRLEGEWWMAHHLLWRDRGSD